MPKRRTVDEDSELGSNVGDDDDDAEDIAPAKAKKARSGNIFIDDRAVDDDDEDAEDDDEDEEGLDEYEEDLDAEAVDQREGEALNRKLDAQRRKEEDAKLQEQVRQRYESADAQGRFMDADDALDQADGRFKELPDASRDPKLWLMRCKPNHEKMLVRALTPLCHAYLAPPLSLVCSHAPASTLFPTRSSPSCKSTSTPCTPTSPYRSSRQCAPTSRATFISRRTRRST